MKQRRRSKPRQVARPTEIEERNPQFRCGYCHEGIADTDHPRLHTQDGVQLSYHGRCHDEMTYRERAQFRIQESRSILTEMVGPTSGVEHAFAAVFPALVWQRPRAEDAADLERVHGSDWEYESSTYLRRCHVLDAALYGIAGFSLLAAPAAAVAIPLILYLRVRAYSRFEEGFEDDAIRAHRRLLERAENGGVLSEDFREEEEKRRKKGKS